MPLRLVRLSVYSLILASTIGCGDSVPTPPSNASWLDGIKPMEVDREILDLSVPERNPNKNAYFGDTHVHTAYSFDAYSFGTLASPHDAYRYARGEALQHPSGYEIQLQKPLDFYVVTDHAMLLGVVKEGADTSTEFAQYKAAEPLHNINALENMNSGSIGKRFSNFRRFLPTTMLGIQDGSIDQEVVNDVSRRAWRDTIEAAKQYNRPGEFTTFVGYEYTSSTNERGNLHRNVIFKGDDKLPALPFSRFNSQNPEGLWNWMDGLREQGIESLAIPHNSNGSNGAMFQLTDWTGNNINQAYSEQRLRNEPLVEITQVKGTSETHPALSPNDEWAGFEIAPYRVATTLFSEPKGSYVREALMNGLMLEQNGQGNPYKFGISAASDTHVAGGSLDEETYFSKTGLLDGKPENRGSVPAPFLYGTLLKMISPDTVREIEGRDYMSNGTFETWAASGITGVWAEQNTRDDIYNAFRRKETFGTSGPRMLVRFFASNHFSENLVEAPNRIELAYQQGVSMGGELVDQATAPEFLVVANAATNGTPLQRVQIIKGWMNDGKPQERVFDVACSDGRNPDPGTHRCADNGAKIDLSNCSVSTHEEAGSTEIATQWTDPEWTVGSKAFYYVRALENPTCRWSTWDAIRAGVEPRPDLPKTIQERVWSSPIWVN